MLYILFLIMIVSSSFTKETGNTTFLTGVTRPNDKDVQSTTKPLDWKLREEYNDEKKPLKVKPNKKKLVVRDIKRSLEEGKNNREIREEYYHRKSSVTAIQNGEKKWPYENRFDLLVKYAKKVYKEVVYPIQRIVI